jgi:hypothetical protein
LVKAKGKRDRLQSYYLISLPKDTGKGDNNNQKNISIPSCSLFLIYLQPAAAPSRRKPPAAAKAMADKAALFEKKGEFSAVRRKTHQKAAAVFF